MNRRIYIYDCDYISNPESFNVKAMRISSFYQQLNDKVILIKDPTDKLFNYDKIYILKEEVNTKLPPPHIMGDPKAVCCGAALDYFPNYKDLPWEIMAVRPNYLLYNNEMLKRNRKNKAQFLQLTYKGHELILKQNFTNSFKGVIINMIEDEELWSSSEEVIISVLQELKKYSSIVFKHPIYLKPIMKNKQIKQLFLELKFDKKMKSTFKNNYGGDINSLKEIIDMINEHKYKNSFKPLKIQSQPTENERNDFFRDLELIDYAKQREVRITITCPRYTKTYIWEYFVNLRSWMNNYPRISYIEYMTRWSVKKTNKTIEEILNNKNEWFSTTTQRLIYLINTYPEEMNKYMFRRWGEENFKIKLDYDYLKKGL